LQRLKRNTCLDFSPLFIKKKWPPEAGEERNNKNYFLPLAEAIPILQIPLVNLQRGGPSTTIAIEGPEIL